MLNFRTFSIGNYASKNSANNSQRATNSNVPTFGVGPRPRLASPGAWAAEQAKRTASLVRTTVTVASGKIQHGDRDNLAAALAPTSTLRENTKEQLRELEAKKAKLAAKRGQ